MKFLRLQRTTFTEGCCDDGVTVAPVVDNAIPLSVSASIDTAPNYGLNIIATLNHVWPLDVTVTGRYKYKPNPVPEAYGEWSVVIPAGSLSAKFFAAADTWQVFVSYAVCISKAIDSKGVEPLYASTICDVSFNAPVPAPAPVYSGYLWAYIARTNARVYKGATFADFAMRVYKGDSSTTPPAPNSANLYSYTGDIPYQVEQTGAINDTNKNLVARFANQNSVDINLQPVSKDGNVESIPGDTTLYWEFRDAQRNQVWLFIKGI